VVWGGICEAPDKFIDVADTLDSSQGTSIADEKAIRKIRQQRGVGGSRCSPGVVELFEVPSVLVDLEILFGEDGAEGTEPLLCDSLERAKVHNLVGVPGVEVCALSDGVEAIGDGFNSNIYEGIHLVPWAVCSSRTHLVSKRVIALNFTGGLSARSEIY
jgi:hypothetical protein